MCNVVVGTKPTLATVDETDSLIIYFRPLPSLQDNVRRRYLHKKINDASPQLALKNAAPRRHATSSGDALL